MPPCGRTSARRTGCCRWSSTSPAPSRSTWSTCQAEVGPSRRARPAGRSFPAAAGPLTVGPATTDGLRALARARGATLFMAPPAAYQVLLGRYARTDDVVVGCPVAGRGRAELEHLIGFFAGSLPL